MQSESITTNVVSSNATHGEVNSIQHYVIKCASERHDITEILLKVALNTITLTPLIASVLDTKLCNKDFR